MRKIALYLIIQIALIIGVGEVAARLIFASPLSYEQVMANAVEHPERLFAADTDVTYDITGLYWSSTTARLRTNADRLIIPSEAPNGRMTILFLGGSTTEAIYVDEAARWVARLNSDTIVTYNAGQSGANILDKIYSLRYLNGLGLRYDRVILMTPNNDFAWVRRLGELGYAFEPESYLDGLGIWAAETTAPERPLRILSFLDQFKPKETVVESYRRRTDTNATAILPLAECGLYQDWIDEFKRVMPGNIAALKQQVVKQGGQLAVMTETTSYGAPAASFLEDWRVPVPCGNGVLSSADAMRFYDAINAAYRDSAQAVGVPVIDLAAMMNPYTNGADGGRYQYDSIHYTDVGSALVANLLQTEMEIQWQP
jgi:hypothetical protein